MILETVFNTTCYTLSHALVWFALGCMAGYVFKPEKRRRKK